MKSVGALPAALLVLSAVATYAQSYSNTARCLIAQEVQAGCPAV